MAFGRRIPPVSVEGSQSNGMAAPSEILNLVDRFDRNIEAYRSTQYNETQVRREFLDPFFKALGWDVYNEQGAAEAYKDVIHEESIRIADRSKAPDYGFRIGGTRKFFVEAKRPSVRIENEPLPAFQLRRYAWSSKLPLSILTNFEDFAVYDCRPKPAASDGAGIARIFLINYKEYADRWDEIAAIFSKDAIVKGAFDKFAETTKGKKGTAEVDEAFLREIESWRDMLARNLALRNPDLETRELNFAVQRIIDRIIFLRIAEDRGIEDYRQLMALTDGGRVYSRLCEYFHRADERYNSGLFHFQPERGRLEPPDELTLGLKVDDELLTQIIGGLYYPDSPYEFSVLPADILGQVYEQFLGKVIRLTAGHRAVVDDKPEVKKAGGVYYTPTYIVDYIVRQTVGAWLSGKSIRQAAKLRVLDPACGSGSFLIEAYQFLLDWYRDQYIVSGPTRQREKLYRGQGGEWRLTSTERKRILLANIYGVDIDPQAVEVTKLALLLKVLEGESGESIERQRRLFRERALPDLGANIKCGNSLIGPEFYESQQLSLLNDAERERVNIFDWQSEFSSIMQSGGFDAVIGNPPYGAFFNDGEKKFLTAHYVCQTYQLDSYLLFLERALTLLLRSGGYYGMIIPNPWLTNLLQTNTRRFVVENSRVLEIVHFKFPVFPKVTVDTQIVLLQNLGPNGWIAKAIVVDSVRAFTQQNDSDGIQIIQHKQRKWRALKGSVINIFLSAAEESLARKCQRRSTPLEELCTINVGIKPYQVGKGTPPQTRKIVDARIFDGRRRVDKTYRRYLRGSDIGRYRIAPEELRYLSFGPWLAEPRPAADFDAPVKIVMRQTGDSLVAALDTDGYLCLNNMHVLVPRGIEPASNFILGVVNSRLLNWYYRTLNPEVGEALAEVKKSNVAQLPIRVPNFKQNKDRSAHDRMVRLVGEMLTLNQKVDAARTDHAKATLQRQIAAIDRQIDRLVYDLYGLSDREIAIVEQSSAR
jgi:type I restriction-modification system DNA methylase subunit